MSALSEQCLIVPPWKGRFAVITNGGGGGGVCDIDGDDIGGGGD